MAAPTPPQQSIPAVQTPNKYTSPSWFPKPFATPQIDNQELDLAIKTAYTNLYQLQYAAPQAVSALQGSKVSTGAVTVLGSLKGVATGLSTLSNVVASIDSGSTPMNMTVSATPNLSTPGQFDVYVFAPTSTTNSTPVLASANALVRWHAWGT